MDPDQARHLLQRRVDAYSDELCAKMLRVLDLLLTLRESVDQTVSRPAVDAALGAFVCACRKVSFDHTIFHTQPGQRPESLLIAEADQAAVDAVVDELDALQQHCDKQGDFQEYFDAHGTAITYWQAATYVQHARVTLT
jgi:hypothetical protein